MRYRINRKTGDRISEIGLGTAYIYKAGTEEGAKALRAAYDGGINYFDLAAGGSQAFPIFREGLGDVRQNVMYQIHFGADYLSGEYGWTLDADRIKRSVEWQLETLKTDYIDYGFIHCQDESSDWETYRKNGVYDLLVGMKESGVVRHIGLSSHTPSVIMEILDDVPADMLMFSVNPAYDWQTGEYARGEADEREAVYRRCERDGIGISVMKPFSGGQLLDAKTSPFKAAMTEYQCIRYCLDKPGVLTVLPGASDIGEIRRLLAYCDKSEEELDYSFIGSFVPSDSAGRCVYCNHCSPCPAGIDIGLVNKYYDLALSGDALAAEHYRTLEINASDCLGCGHCDGRCPFGVEQSARMSEISGYFG